MTDVAPPVSPPPPTDPPAPRRRVSRGVLWASGLAVVVLAIATIVAFTADTGGKKVQGIQFDGESQLQGRDLTGEAVPDIALDRFDGGELIGTTGSLADYRGQPMVVNFFASNCTPCVTEMPDFEQVRSRTGANVAFVGVDTLEQQETGSQIIKQTGVGYNILFDKQGQIATAIDLLNMPTTLFVDANGTIVKVHTGRLSQSDLETIIRDDLHA
jgi:peroxiredoxin